MTAASASERSITRQWFHRSTSAPTMGLSDARRILQAIRSHWGIENSLHWTLDIAIVEDQSRVRKDRAPENLAIIRYMALNLLKQEKTDKCSIKVKRLQYAWSEDYLLKVLAGA